MENRQPCTTLFACPVCGGPLSDGGAAEHGGRPEERGGSARCPEGHSFDYARSGYLNLKRTGRGRGRVGDTAEMVRARAEFQATGHYGRVAEAVAGAAAEAVAQQRGIPAASVIAEIGCGTGYHLDAVRRGLSEAGVATECAFGFDLSKAAVAHASRNHRDLRLAVADVEEQIPLRDSCADLVLSAFAPRPGAELARVIRPGGELVVAFAGPRHLKRLRERLNLLGVGEDKFDRLTERLGPWFEVEWTTAVDYDAVLSVEEARHLVLMGPNAWHDVDATTLKDDLTDTISVVVARFSRR
jgi:SAM-dependent methyltransferase